MQGRMKSSPHKVGFQPVQSRLDLSLADGDIIEDGRARSGKVVVLGTEKGNTICCMNRLVQNGCDFAWSLRKGPTLTLPAELDHEVISLRLHNVLHNGLPYLDFSVFKRLRPLMSRHWKSTCHSLTTADASVSSQDTSQEESDSPTPESNVCAEAVGIEDLHRLRAIPDPKTLYKGFGPKPRPCPRREEIMDDESRAAELLLSPEKITNNSVHDLSNKSSLKPEA